MRYLRYQVLHKDELCFILVTTWGVRGGAVGFGIALQAGRSLARFPMVSLDFFINIIDSASNRNEYQECFLGVKTGGA